MQRARSLFVKATLSHDPRVVRKANENLSAMLHQSPPPGRERDDNTAAVVGAALVGLALLAIFSGSGDSSGGSGSGGSGTSTTTGAPFGGGSSSTAPKVNWSNRPDPPRPMVGNIGKTYMGLQGMNPPIVGR